MEIDTLIASTLKFWAGGFKIVLKTFVRDVTMNTTRTDGWTKADSITLEYRHE